MSNFEPSAGWAVFFVSETWTVSFSRAASTSAFVEDTPAYTPSHSSMTATREVFAGDSLMAFRKTVVSSMAARKADMELMVSRAASKAS